MPKGKWTPAQKRVIRDVGKKVGDFIADDLSTQYESQQRESDRDNERSYKTISEWLGGKSDD